MAQRLGKARIPDLPGASHECGRRGVVGLLADTTTPAGSQPALGTTHERTLRGPDRHITPNPATTVNFNRDQGRPPRTSQRSVRAGGTRRCMVMRALLPRPMIVLLAVIMMAVAACSDEPGAGPQREPTSKESPTGGETKAGTDETSPATGAGIPDPDGRIAFGRITREDPVYGQVVELFAIDPDGSDAVRLNEGESSFPSWSPDGSRLAYTTRLDDGSWQVATMAPDGSDVKVLTAGPGIHEVTTWSPDGTWLAYSYSPLLPNDPGFHTVLWRIAADGTNPRRLGNPRGFDIEPHVSPDGTSVVFQRLDEDGETGTLMVRNLASGKETPLPAAGKVARHPAWSPDGNWIAYNLATTPAHQDQVEKIAADGSGKPVVLFRGTDTRAGFKPEYSPDGTRILFGCKGVLYGSDDDACVMNADGSDVRVLVGVKGTDENHFSWGPPAS